MIKLTKDQFEAIEWRAPARGSSQVAGVAWVGMLRDQELAALMPEGFIDPDRGVAESRSENLGREAGALLVKFTSGGVYVYEDVAEAQAQELLDSSAATRSDQRPQISRYSRSRHERSNGPGSSILVPP